MPHSQGHFINPYLSRINPIPRIDTYFWRDNVYKIDGKPGVHVRKTETKKHLHIEE